MVFHELIVALAVCIRICKKGLLFIDSRSSGCLLNALDEVVERVERESKGSTGSQNALPKLLASNIRPKFTILRSGLVETCSV